MDFPISPSLNDIYTFGERSWIWNGSGWKLLKASNTSITASSLLASIKTVDGTGSGLDADLLDGQHGSYYLDLTNATGTLAANQVATLGPSNLESNTYNININGNVTGNLTGRWGAFSQEQYAFATRAQRNITGGGTISVSNSGTPEVNWTSRFIVIANGKGTETTTSGYFDITVPAAGTSIPIVGGTSVTTTANGIPLANWQGLYYILPLGQGSSSLSSNFRIIDYTLTSNIPADWVLICVNNADQTMYYFPNGIKLRPGENILPATTDARNSAQLGGYTWAAPAAIGSTAANTGAFTTLTASANVNIDTGTLFVDSVNNRVGIGNSAPGARVTILADSANTLQFTKPDGTNLLRNQWDGSNFHHYVNGTLYYNLANVSVVFSGGGNPATNFVTITNGARFVGNDNASGSTDGLFWSGPSSYANSTATLTKITPLKTQTWAWNGVDGFSVLSSTFFTQRQISNTNNDAVLYFTTSDSNTASDMFRMYTSNGNVEVVRGNFGVGNTAPPNKLFVTGDIGLDGISVRDTATTTTTDTTQITLFEYPIATYDSCDVIVKAVTGGECHTTKLLVTANSTVAIATEYGTLQTGSSLYSVDVDVTSSNTRIRITPASATSTVFKASYELITA